MLTSDDHQLTTPCTRPPTGILGFKCPVEDTHNRFYPYPRYYYHERAVITCVNGQPRLIHCPEGKYADGNSLTCLSYDKDDKQSA